MTFSPYLLQLDPITVADVVSFQGKESISSFYRFDMQALVDDGAERLDWLGKRVRLQWTVGPETLRIVYGVASRIEMQGLVGKGKQGLKVRIEPRAVGLRHRRGFRVFEDMSVPEIVATLLREHGVAYRERLQRTYPPRLYCVQHGESDYAFVDRLLREEGIFYAFDHPLEVGGDENVTSFGSTEVLVLCDTAEYYPRLEAPDTLRFRRGALDHALKHGEDSIGWFSVARRVRPTSDNVRRYDFRNPLVQEIDLAKRTDGPAYAASGAPGGSTTEHDGFAEIAPPMHAPARVRREQADAERTLVEGRTACPRLQPMRVVRIADHDAPASDGDYVVSSLTHDGKAPVLSGSEPTYQCLFTGVPADTPLRPSRRKRRLVRGTETAIVVGPPGQPVFVDPFGRVQVRFHWEGPEGERERRQCWLRVMQPWAGTAFGAQFIPRVGMEVVVSFLSGDPDSPVIIGCVYNGLNPVPFSLPANGTRSGLRTQSLPTRDGFNELHFEDTSGAEVVYLRAQRDFVRDVLNDEKTIIGNDRVTDVAHDDLLVVGNQQIEQIGGSRTMRSMSSGQVGQTTGDATLGLVEGDISGDATGKIAFSCAGDASIKAGGSIGLTAGSDIALKAGGNITLEATGDISVKAGGLIEIKAGAPITIDGAVVKVQGGVIKLNS